jgi:hypothetical protein
MSLRPQNIIGAAQADLARRERNKLRFKGQLDDALERYAFLGSHVRRANSVRHLLDLAIKKPVKGQAAGKRNTRIIYGDADLLKQALELSP